MSVPQKKSELLKEIDRSFTLLQKKLDTISDKEAFAITLEGHAKGTHIKCRTTRLLLAWLG